MSSSRSGFLPSALDVLARLTLSLWLGGMIFFSAVVAQSAFAVLPTRQLAGTIVNSVLGKLETMGLVCGVLTVGLMFAAAASSGKLQTWLGRLAVALPLLMTVDVAISKFVVSAKLSAMRASMGADIDKLPLTDPLRVAFGNLHGYSVMLMGINILAAIAMVVIHQRLTRQND